MADWYRTHSLSPEAYPESEYLSWAQDNGLYVDEAGNVDYGPPEPPAARYRQQVPGGMPEDFWDEGDEDGPCPNTPPCEHPALAHDPWAGPPGDPPWCLDCDCGSGDGTDG